MVIRMVVVVVVQMESVDLKQKLQGVQGDIKVRMDRAV